MAKMVNLTIDGIQVKAPEGTNLIEAAEIGGIHIPNLCYMKGMKPIGACRLCLVEVEGGRGPVVGCVAKVKEGMVVTTKNEKIQEMRKFVIDLVLSMHPLDCMTCTKAGVCNLQQYAYDFEIKESSFTRKKFGYPVDAANPFIKRDPEYCILCARCVRVCKNQGTEVLDFMGRGVGAKVVTANDKPLQESSCTFCGSCVDACPVNALLEADRWRKGREWEYEKKSSVCLLCGNSCNINVSTKDGIVAKIAAGTEDGLAEKYICAIGRFAFDAVEADTRLTVPMKKEKGKLVETTWKDALDIVGKGLKKAGKNAGIISTAGILNEDALTMKKMADSAKTKNIDTTVSLYGDSESILSDTADLESADVIVAVDLDISQWTRTLPALDAIIRKKVNSGTKLVVVSAAESPLSSVAAVSMTGKETDALKAIAHAMIKKGAKADKALDSAVSKTSVSEAAESAADLIMNASNAVILSSPAFYNASANVAMIKGTAVSVPLESNAKGVIAMGATTGGKSFDEMVNGNMPFLYIVGDVPAKKKIKADFLVVQGTHMTDLAKQADVVLPAASYLEDGGTIVDYLGRIRKVNKATDVSGEAKAHRTIFAGVLKAMGSSIKEAKETDTKKLAKKKIKQAVSPFEKKKFAVKNEDLLEKLNETVISNSRLIWLKEGEKVTT